MQQATDPRWRGQRGAATLLVALVLMMSLTIVTLSVAHTQLIEQRMAGNEQWQTRLSLLADAGLAQASALAELDQPSLSWTLDGARNLQVAAVALESGVTGVDTRLVVEHHADFPRFLFQQVTTTRNDGSGLHGRASRFVRTLSVLSPLAEDAPPLILNGCVTSAGASFDIRPRNADGGEPEAAVWLHRNRPCPALVGIDLHGGSIAESLVGDDLWPLLFSIDREAFTALSEQQAQSPADQRIYWALQEDELAGRRWLHSLGTPERPVVLYFPAETGCPEFAPGVQLYGVVFIDAECADPIAAHSFAIYGSLAVNGNLNPTGSRLQLNHIQVADPLQTQLRLPILRSVVVPGTWRDF